MNSRSVNLRLFEYAAASRAFSKVASSVELQSKDGVCPLMSLVLSFPSGHLLASGEALVTEVHLRWQLV